MKPFLETSKLWPETAALFIADMQYCDAHRDYGMGKALAAEGVDLRYFYQRIERLIVPNIRRLLDSFRRKGGRVAYSYFCSEVEGCGDWPRPLRKRLMELGLSPCRPGMKEYEVLEEIRPQPGEITVRKHCISPFHNTGISDILRGLGVTDVVITGIATHGAPGMAALYAANDGFHVVMVEDALGSFSQEVHEKWLELHQGMYFRVARTQEVIAEIEGP